MIDKRMEILNHMQEELRTVCSSISPEYKPEPEEYPHIWINQAENAVTVVDLENHECAVKAVVELQTWVQGSLEEGMKLAEEADSVMRDMYFDRIQGWKQTAEAAAPGVILLKASYSRVIADGDSL